MNITPMLPDAQEFFSFIPGAGGLLRYHAAAMAKDYYDILGIERTASQEDIKRTYRRLSKELHPDKHKGDKEVEKRYQAINEAYETLSNPKKRQMYDQFGAAGPQAGAGFGGFQGFGGFGAEDMGGFADIFENFFGGARAGRQRQQDQRGSDIEAEITIPFQEAVTGAQRRISLRALSVCTACGGTGAEKESGMVACDHCGGTGQITRTVQSFFGTLQQSSVCPQCGGSGKVPKEPCRVCGGEGRKEDTRERTVEIPAGIHEGQTLRLRGQGNAGRQGAQAGDLFLHIRIMPDSRFERDGDDIRSSYTISVPDAVLGTQKEVDTVQGRVTLKIPAGTQPGQVFRLKGKGMPIIGSSRHGDHYTTIQVEIPVKLSRKEKELLEEWQKIAE